MVEICGGVTLDLKLDSKLPLFGGDLVSFMVDTITVIYSLCIRI